MEEGGGQEDFGDLIKNARLQLGMSRDSLARLTRIPVSNIVSIEMNDHAALPESVYVKGFIKACCGALGLNNQAVSDSYAESLRLYLLRTGSKETSWTYRRAFLLLILVFVSVFAFSISYKKLSFHAIEPVKEQESDIVREIDQGVESDNAAEEKVPEGITLTILGREKALVKLIIDGDLPKRIDIAKDSRFDFKAKKNFNLLIEDPKNVEIAFDGKPFTIPGNDQVINIFYP